MSKKMETEENEICRLRSTGQGKPVRYVCRFGINLKAVFTKRRLLMLPNSLTFRKPVMEEERVDFYLPWPPGGRRTSRWRPPGPAGTELGGASRAGWHWGALLALLMAALYAMQKCKMSLSFLFIFFLSKPAA